MANQEQLDILKQGMNAWNKWRAENKGVQIDLSGATLYGADLSHTDLSHADLSTAGLRHANLSGANLSDATLSGATLYGATLYGATLYGATLYGATLYGATLSGATLSGATLSGATLRRVDLSDATLSGATLRHADLSHTDLSRVDLSGATLYGATLSHATLSHTDLRTAGLRTADLSGATLYGATLAYTVFGYSDLSTVKGLEAVNHEGPSTIGIDTIYRSQGKIPEAFLKGAGVPDSFIEYMRSLVGSPIDYYSCFISYSSKDEALARRLYADLQSNHVRCWFAPEDLKIGAKIRPSIDESIRLHDKLLLILSQYSVTSQWIEQEVERALARERKEEKVILFPIRLDQTVMDMEEGWPALIRNTRNIGDFTHWKRHDAYQKAFDRLLRDLKMQ